MRRARRIAATTILCSLVLTGCGAGAGTDSSAGSADRAAPANRARLVAAGDIACEPGSAVTSNACQQAATAKLARSLSPDAVLALGDLQYPAGSLADFRASYDKSWGALREITLPVVGNHEYGTSGAAGFKQYFGISGRTYGASRVGAWRIYRLDSNCTVANCAAQRKWLDRSLTKHPTRCSLIAFHHPRYSSGLHGNNPIMAKAWKVAMRHGVDVALSGHDHLYERFRPMRAYGRVDRARGITSFVSGAGGKSHYGFKKRAGSAYVQNEEFGVLLLKLRPSSFRWKFKSIDGETLDKGRRRCH